MSKRKKNEKAKEEKGYTYPEILDTYFPNAEEIEEEKNGEYVLTPDNFFDILTKVTKPHKSDSKRTKTLA